MSKKIYCLKVSLAKKLYREIEISGQMKLHRLAEEITKSYGFYFDHCFGFSNNLKCFYNDADEIYELFADIEDCDSDSGSVKKTAISTVFEKGKAMTFLFDYGDDWQFLVECTDVKSPEQGCKYPRTANSKGEAPEQYPDYDDDWDDDDEDAA